VREGGKVIKILPLNVIHPSHL